MKLAVYTSCTLNYLPKARALAESLKTWHPDAVIVLLLNDAVPEWLGLRSEQFDAVWAPQDLGYDRGWVFRHNVIELCTAVKGRGLRRLLQHAPGRDLYAYLDPDVFIYGALDPVMEYLGEGEIGLVPHINKPEATQTGVELTELSVLAHGTYNLGHLFVRDGGSSRAFIDWWADRLDVYCLDEKCRGLFTDQRWCDPVPALFDKVTILRQPNLDVASWNVHGREIVQSSGDGPSFEIDGYPLLTYHFSGTGPSGTHRWVREALAPASGAVAEIERGYEAVIARHGQAFFEHWPYAGDVYDDGLKVSIGARKFYREHRPAQRRFPDPYLTGPSGYSEWLKLHRPDLTRGVKLTHDQALRSFNALFDEGYYLANYPDVLELIASGRMETALQHYLELGSALRYDPNLYFVSSYYVDRLENRGSLAPEQGKVGRVETSLLWHYLTVGIQNGIEPVRAFDSNWYLEQHSDLARVHEAKVHVAPLAHFARHGDAERRRPSPDFDPARFEADSAEARALIERGSAPGPFGAYVMLGYVPGRVHYELLDDGAVLPDERKSDPC